MDRRTVLCNAGVLLAGAVFGPVVRAAETCGGFRWDAAAEMALFQGQPVALTAGRSAAVAPLIEAGRLYEAGLASEDAIEFAAPPARLKQADGTYAGILRLRVATAGRYRVSLGAHAWIDMAVAGQPLASVGFQGNTGCMPDKIVLFDLPADTDLFLQLSGNPTPAVRVAITAVPPG